jgi:hypothetical protein
MTFLRDSGTSTSSTPGTKVAEIIAGSGKSLVDLSINASQDWVASTQMRVIITYTDDTTTTADTSTNQPHSFKGNDGGLSRFSSLQFSQRFVYENKDIKSVRVETLDTGTGNRVAILSATEVDSTSDLLKTSVQVTTGTENAEIASIEADSGKVLSNFSVIATSPSTANSNISLIVTYEDATTTEVTTTAGTASFLHANMGGVLNNSSATAFENKKVVKLSVVRRGTGSGTRTATLSAMQVESTSLSAVRSADNVNSTTPGTLVAEIEAPTGKHLYNPAVVANSQGNSNCFLRFVVTYIDNSIFISEPGNLATSTQRLYWLNSSGSLIDASSTSVQNTSEGFDKSKKIKKVRVETFGTGSGDRAASLSALTADLIQASSCAADPGFANVDTPADTSPFNSGDKISYTIQAGDELPAGTYYWRVRGKDSTGLSAFSDWSTPREFEVTASGGVTETHTIDTLARAEATATHTVDTLVKNIQTDTHTIDTLAKVAETATHTIDTLTRAEQTNSHTVDTLAREEVITDHTIDTLILAEVEASHTIDTLVSEPETGCFLLKEDGDFILQENGDKILLESCPVDSETVTHTADTLVRAEETQTHTVDTLARAEQTVTHTVDTLARASATQNHTVDTLARVEQTATHTADTLVRGEQTSTHTVDTLARAEQTNTHTIDTLARADVTNTHTVDALVRATATQTHTVDTLVRITATQTHTIDNLVRATETATHSIDTVVSVPGDELYQHTVDTNVRAVQDNTHTVDTNVYQTATATHTVDSLVRASVVTDHTIDVLVRDDTGTGNIKYWNDTDWEVKQLKCWDGATWVDAPLKRWNGVDWELITY